MALFRSDKNERPPAPGPQNAGVQATPRPAPPPGDDEESVLGRGVSIKGDMTFEGSMRLEGKIEGRIVAQGRFTVGPGAVVLGDVTAAEAVIEGILRGNITATDRIVVAPTGEVSGDIRATRLVVQEGGKLLGQHDIDSESMSQPPPPKTAAPKETLRPPIRPAKAVEPVKAPAGAADPFANAL